MKGKRPSVFLSHVKEDKKMVRRIYQELIKHDLDVWFDEESLLVGQNWKREITKAIENTDYMLVLLSESSNKSGYFHSELRKAIEIQKRKPQATIYIIPVKLEECELIHSELEELHILDLYHDYDEGIRKLIQAFGLPINTEDKHNSPKVEEKPYLSSIEIENFFSLKNIQIQDLNATKEIYFLGENGDGKTLLLQAILYALKRKKIEELDDQKDIGFVNQLLIDNFDFNASNNTSFKYHLQDSNENSYSNHSIMSLEHVFAYGVNRNHTNSEEHADKEGFLTLFKNDAELLHPIDWLKEQHRLALKKNTPSKLDLPVKLLEDLLDNNVRIEIDEDITFNIQLQERQTSLKFEQLSEGYRNVMTWVADLLAKLTDKQPEVKELKGYRAIVLVDEIGLHLHPTWKIGLAKKLRQWFPNIQFIFTTHSPTVIMGASKDAVVYRLYKEQGITKVSEAYPCSEMSHLMLNGVITSPLFGLESARMQTYVEGVDDLDTSEDYTYGEIRRQIDIEVKRLKKAGKVYFSKTDIQAMVKDALSKYQKNNISNDKNQ